MNNLEILKIKLGISTNVRDEYLEVLLKSVIIEFTNLGIYDLEDVAVNNLVVDFAFCKYKEIEPFKYMENLKKCLIIKSLSPKQKK